MKVLGINAFHPDASAALVVDGDIVMAVEEERLSRIKHHYGFPYLSIAACLERASLHWNELDAIVVPSSPLTNLYAKASWALRNPLDVIDAFSEKLAHYNRPSADAGNLKTCLSRAFGTSPHGLITPIIRCEHHLAHLGAAFYCSPFSEATLLSLDGMGDFCSGAVGSAGPNHFKVSERTFFPHSLGYLYTAVTQMLGFLNYGDEFKVMGLAPYGNPKYLPSFRRLVRVRGCTIELNQELLPLKRRHLKMTANHGHPKVLPFLQEELLSIFGVTRKQLEKPEGIAADIASSLQSLLEEIVLELLENLPDEHKRSCLCFAGGVAMNSVLAGKIERESGFEEVYLPPGAADNGISIGAALYYTHWIQRQERKHPLSSAALGPSFSDDEVRTALNDAELTFEELTLDQIVLETAKRLSQGQLVGWMQGGLEFGARALGQRSILADPRRAEMKDKINRVVKQREPFRPFAPSVQIEKINDYFDYKQAVPFMEKVVPVHPHRREEIPAVTHVDGSARVQTVDREFQPLYWELLEEFGKITSTPVLLNTSFNQQEPIVNSPEEAISCFRRSNLDALVIGGFLISSKPE